MENCMEKRPNILFCLADDAGMHFGAYGCSWVNTPAFDRVAREGILFKQAYTCDSKCAPSRAAILTGRNSWQLKDAANHQCYFPAEFKTVFEELSDQGYHVGHTAKGWAPGDPGTVAGEPRRLTGPGYNLASCIPPTDYMNTCDYASNFEAFLDDKPENTPFCFWYGCMEPHRPYEFRSGIEKNHRQPEDIDQVYGIWPDNQVVRTDLLDYGFEIEHFDGHVGRMLATLEERGELENTLVVVTSDNGMPFPRAKGQEYYYSNHLPLAIMWPAHINRPGRTISDRVSFIDFAPTFIECAGIKQDAIGMAPMTGKSLKNIFEADGGDLVDPSRDHVLIGKERHDVGRPGDVGYPIRGIFKGDYLYLHNFEIDRWPAGNPETGYLNCDGSPTKTEILKLRNDPEDGKYWTWSFGKRPTRELYNVQTDPDCLRNLADDPEHQSICESMADQLWQELREQDDPRLIGNGTPLDENPTNEVTLRNLHARILKGEASVPGWVNAEDVQEP